MAIVTAEDVAAGVLTKWEADVSGIVALVPGGLHFQRVKATPAVSMPYALLAVEEGEQEDFSGTDFIKRFTFRIDCYGEQPSSTLAMRRALHSLFDRAAALTITNGTMLSVRPVGGKLEITTERSNASDVVLSSGVWEVLLQGSRA